MDFFVSLCVFLCLFYELCLCARGIFLSLKNSFTLYFVNGIDSITWGRNGVYFIKLFNRILQGIKSRSPNNPG